MVCLFLAGNLLFISLYFGYKTVRLFVQGKKALLCNLLSWIFIVATYGQGNTNEEFCLPWIVVSMYLVFKLLITDEVEKKRNITLVFLGVSTFVTFLIRANNAAPVVGLLLYLLLKDCTNHDWRQLGKDIIASSIGAVVIVIPIVVYLISEGALEAMWQASIVYNMGVVSEFSADLFVRKALKALPIVFMIFNGLLYKENRKIGYCLAVTSLISLPTLLVGSGYWHYFILVVWYVPVAFAVFLQMKGQLKEIVVKGGYVFALLCCVLYGRNVLVNVKGIYVEMTYGKESIEERNEEIKDLYSAIPQEERDDLMTYNAEGEFYLESGTLPNYKYFTLQSSQSRVRPEINEEWNQEFEKRQPRWVVWNIAKNCNNETFMSRLSAEYELYGVYDTYYLYLSK